MSFCSPSCLAQTKRWYDFKNPGSQADGSFLGFTEEFKGLENGYPGGEQQQQRWRQQRRLGKRQLGAGSADWSARDAREIAVAEWQQEQHRRQRRRNR